MLNDNIYENLLINNYPELSSDEYLQNLVQQTKDLYDSYIYNKDGWHIDNDTSYEVYMSGEMRDGLFYCYKIRIDFEFLDDMNDVVSQSMNIDFTTGNTFIMDDDFGCVYNQNFEDYKLY